MITPLGWTWALVVWTYAVAGFVVSDWPKLLAYRIFDPVNSKHQAVAPAD